MNKWNFSIFGSDYDILDGNGNIMGFPPLSALTQTDLSSFQQECLGLYPKPTFNDGATEYLDGYKETSNKTRKTYALKFYPKEFPTEETDDTAFYELDTLDKRFLWIYVPQAYNLRPKGLDLLQHSLYVMRVNKAGLEVDETPGKKSITLQLESPFV